MERRSALFLNVLDVVFEDEEVGLAITGEADERLIVILDHALDLLAVFHLHADGSGMLDELLEVFDLFERLLRGASAFALL
jgi:hypothetical protein